MFRIGVIAYLPKDINSKLTDIINDFHNANQTSHWKSMIDLHLSVLYTPIFYSIETAVDLVKNSNCFPASLSIGFEGWHVSNYGTLQAILSRNDSLKKLHKDLLHLMTKDAFLFTSFQSPKQVYSFFNTSNVNNYYVPHVTIEKSPQKRLLKSLQKHLEKESFDFSFQISVLWITNAEGNPHIPLLPIKLC